MIAAVARWTGWRGIAQQLARPSEASAPPLSVGLAVALLALIGGGALVLHLLGTSAGTSAALLSTAGAAAIVVAYLLVPKAALLVFALLMLFSDTVGRYLGFAIASLDELAVPALFIVAALRTRPWASGRLSAPREAAVAAVLGLAVISSLVNGVPLPVWLPGFVLLAKVIAFLYVAAWQDWTAADIRNFATVVLPVGAVVTGLGYVEAIDPQAFRDALGLPSTGAARGELPSIKSVFNHPVLFGWFAAVIGLYLFAGWTVYRRWWMLLGGIFFSAAVILSARRRAIVGIAAGLALGVLSQLRRAGLGQLLLRGWAPIAAGLLVLLLAFSPGIGDLIGLTGRDYVEPTIGETPSEAGPGAEAPRVLLYRGSISVAAEHFPLGAGLGRYGSWMSRVEYSPIYRELGFDRVWGLRPDYPNFITDTFWPQILGEIGVLGLTAYLLFVAIVGLDLWRAARAFSEPLLAWFCLGTLMVFGHALVETLASSLFHSPPRVYLLFGAVGMAIALLRQRAPGAVERG